VTFSFVKSPPAKNSLVKKWLKNKDCINEGLPHGLSPIDAAYLINAPAHVEIQKFNKQLPVWDNKGLHRINIGT
jgi:hypothetical protein